MEHHAYGYVGIELARKSLGVQLEAHDPDVWVTEHDAFSVDDARVLRVRASSTPVVASVQTFIIIANTLTNEAQNALLKLFEEPPARTVFHLVVSKRGQLLPTLQSRLFFVEDDAVMTNDEVDSFKQFRLASLADRLEQVATIVKRKDVATAESLVAGAEQVAENNKDPQLLETVMQVRSYFGTRGASTKMLLESLALALPQK